MQATRGKSACTSSSLTCLEMATWATVSGGWTRTRASSSSPPNTRKLWRTAGVFRRGIAKKWLIKRWPELWGTMEKMGRLKKWRRSWPTSSATTCWGAAMCISMVTDEEETFAFYCSEIMKLSLNFSTKFSIYLWCASSALGSIKFASRTKKKNSDGSLSSV